MILRNTGWLAALLITFGSSAAARAGATASYQHPVPSRASLLQTERRARLQEVEAPRRKGLEKGLQGFDNAMVFLGRIQRGWHGLRLAGGDFPAGAGFNYGVGFTDRAVGSVYEDPDMPNRLDLDFVAATSTSQYHQVSADLAIRNLGGTRLSVAGRAKWYEHPEEDFFGLGLDSAEKDRTSYLERGVNFGGDLWIEPLKGLRLGGGLTYSSPSIGSGKDSRFPSTEEIFDTGTIPGFPVQPDFVRTDGLLSFDWRDQPLRPRSGGYYGLRLSKFNDQDLGTYTFRQYEIDLQQYIPWLNRYRVLALRGNLVISDSDAGKDIPFYYMPYLGGGERLRGFREFRFRDRNSLLLTAEYRWEAWWALEMAVFVDAGKVTAKRSDLDFSDLEASYGVGFRFHSWDAVSLRLDLAFSREGFIPFLRYTHVF